MLTCTEKVFRANHNYPNWVFQKVLQQVKPQQQQQEITVDAARKNDFLLLRPL